MMFIEQASLIYNSLEQTPLIYDGYRTGITNLWWL